MPQSYSSLWVHLIWSTKHREATLTVDIRQDVFQTIREIAGDHEIYLDCVDGAEDHVHLLIRLRTDQSVADVVKILKGNSWEKFRDHSGEYLTWQDGYAAFSVSADDVPIVRRYIHNQEKHHREQSFADELKSLKESQKRR